MTSDWTAIAGRLLLDAFIRSVIVVLAVAVILGVLRVRASSVRHAAWTSALFAMLAMPLLTSFLPGIDLPAPWFAPSRAPSLSEPAVTPLPSPSFTMTTDAIPVAVPAVEAPPAANARTIWSTALLIAYGAGVIVLLVRLLIGWYAMRRLIAASEPIAGASRLAQ